MDIPDSDDTQKPRSCAVDPVSPQMLPTSRYDDEASEYRTTDIIWASSRVHYLNRESGQVNSGLSAQPNGMNRSHAFASPSPVADVDLSPFIISSSLVPLPMIPTIEDIVAQLLKPPTHAFVHGVISISWVISVASFTHLECRHADGRFVLRHDSELRTKGRELGIPAAFLEWMCGDDEESSPTEQGMMLTQEFFKNEV